VDPTKTFAASLPGTVVDMENVTLWSFAAGDGTKPKWNGLDSRLLQLNGKPLVPSRSPNYTLPALEELGAAHVPTELKIPPLTINFLAVDGVVHCKSEM
jgi:hypothetical protein